MKAIIMKVKNNKITKKNSDLEERVVVVYSVVIIQVKNREMFIY